MTPQQEITIFFSWQSQLDKNKNTNFIRNALRKVIKKIENKRKNIKFTLDEATRGETGSPREGANKRGNSSRLTQSFHFFMFEPIFSPVNAL
ncbi:MAG: hypothetical protein E6X63_31940, partial [Pseudomonas aeruginosa]|nr:hypothetical protein [Pseudomonas aeruginosa]